MAGSWQGPQEEGVSLGWVLLRGCVQELSAGAAGLLKTCQFCNPKASPFPQISGVCQPFNSGI